MGSTIAMAFALMLVLEGMMPFFLLASWRETFKRIIQLSDGQIRFFGMSSMLAGIFLFLLAR